MILATESSFFRKVLLPHKHGHPLIHMRGLSLVQLGAILDFLYCGETTVSRKNLESFLVVAEQLQLNGLVAEDAEREAEQYKEVAAHEEIFERNLDAIPTVEMFVDEIPTHEMFDMKPKEEGKLPFSGDSKGLAEMVKSMMGKSEKMITRNIRGQLRSQKANVCRQCGKEGMFTTIVDHIEANHITGVSHTCNICGTTTRSRNAMRKHKSKNHTTI